jgi:quercetin dioxygenase-like cupin family protein
MTMLRTGMIVGSLIVGFFPLLTLAADHVAASPDSLKWGPVPPVFPKGAEVAAVAGDPGKEGAFVIRFKVPAGYKVAPHTHPLDENVTVISGTLHVGMGEKFDEAKGTDLPAGGFAKLPPGMAHYVWFTEPTILQLHGTGPFSITYVNPADDPSKKN